MKTVFDIGMYNAADTDYYLNQGFRVVAVEANPWLVENARRKYKTQIESSQLVCINAAITKSGESTNLHISPLDPGSSSIQKDHVETPEPPSIKVPGITFGALLDQYGVPFYAKIDIEGADGLCVQSLDSGRLPSYLSFEIGADVFELIDHANAVGYGAFKVINQTSFRELSNQRSLYDRISQKILHIMGYAEPRKVRRNGDFFLVGHSSGPPPWKSDGRWYKVKSTVRRIRQARQTGKLSDRDWYDIHARLP